MRSYLPLVAIAALAVVAGTAGLASSAHAEEPCPLAACGTPTAAAQVKQSLIGQGLKWTPGIRPGANLELGRSVVGDGAEHDQGETDD